MYLLFVVSHDGGGFVVAIVGVVFTLAEAGLGVDVHQQEVLDDLGDRRIDHQVAVDGMIRFALGVVVAAPIGCPRRDGLGQALHVARQILLVDLGVTCEDNSFS